MGRAFPRLLALLALLQSPGTEDDPGFRRTLESVGQTGMRTAGLLGVVGASVYVLAHILAGGDFTWWSKGNESPKPGVLWNKVLIATIGIVLLIASRRRLGLRSGRLLMALCLLAVAVALLWEDVEGGDFSFTAAWLTLVMFFAVGTVPFKPWQAGVLCVAMMFLYGIFQAVDDSLPEILRDARLIFLGIVSLFCVTMCAAIYRSRAGQYLSLVELRRTLRARFGQEPFPIRPTDVSVMSADERFIDDAQKIVERHIDDSSFDVTTFAQELNMSTRQLQRKLRAIADQRPTDFVRLIRLQRAAQLLEKRAGSVSEIAYAVGFNYPEHFTKCFRELYGRPPSAYAEGIA